LAAVERFLILPKHTSYWPENFIGAIDNPDAIADRSHSDKNQRFQYRSEPSSDFNRSDDQRMCSLTPWEHCATPLRRQINCTAL